MGSESAAQVELNFTAPKCNSTSMSVCHEALNPADLS